MTLVATLTGTAGSADISLVRVSIERGLGCAVSIKLVAVIADDARAQLLKDLTRGVVTFDVLAEGSTLIRGLQICGVAESPGEPAHMIFSGYQPMPNPREYGRRRFRVVRAKDWGQLFETLKPGITVAQSVENHLFSLQAHATGAEVQLLQDGVTDWTFLHLLLKLYRAHSAFRPEYDLVVSQCFNTESKDSGTWRVDWARQHTGKRLKEGDCIDLQHLAADPGGTWHPSMAPARSHIGANGKVQARSFRTFLRDFSVRDAQKWLNRKLPHWDDKESVAIWRVRDHFQMDDRRVAWTTELFDVPEDACLVASYREPRVRPSAWLAHAVVKARDKREPTMDVTLPEYESEASTIRVALSTPYSGANETIGLHFVPEQNTSVLVCGSGGLEPFPVCLGNVRQRATAMDAPAEHVPETVSLAYDTLKLAVKNGTEVSSGRELALKSGTSATVRGKGIKLEMTGGKAEFARE